MWFVCIMEYRDLRQMDAFVVPHFGDLSVLYVKPISVLLNIPIIYISHNSIYYPVVESHARFDATSISGSMCKQIDRTLHSLADRVIVVSKTQADIFSKEFDIAPEKYDVMYTSVDESRFRGVNSTSESTSDVVYWGNFLPSHSVEAILYAAEMLPEVSFTLIGGGGDRREKMIELSANLQLENVNFTGRISEESLCGYIKSATMTVGFLGDNPKARMNIGKKAAEAAYFSKPLIAGDSPANREVFTDNYDSLLVEPADPEDLAANISHLRSERELQEKTSKNIHNTYFEYFHASNQLDCLREVVSQLE